jgi:hypothetical protein
MHVEIAEEGEEKYWPDNIIILYKTPAIFYLYTHYWQSYQRLKGAKICSNVSVKLVAEGFGQLSYMGNFQCWKLSDRIGKS